MFLTEAETVVVEFILTDPAARAIPVVVQARRIAIEMEDMVLVDQGIGCYPLTIDRNRGFLYGIGFTGYFYRFDLKNHVTKNFGRVSNWDICRDIFCDDEGNVYMSNPTSQVTMYNVKKERVYETSLRTPYDPSIFPAQLRNPMIDRLIYGVQLNGIRLTKWLTV